MKKKILCLFLSLLFVAGLFTAANTYAWFAASSGGGSGVGPAGAHSFAAGNVGFTLTGDFKTFTGPSTIVPGDELLAGDGAGCKMSITNTSTIETQLRIRIEYGYNSTVAVYDNSATSPLTVVFTDDALWSYNATDHCFYCNVVAVEEDSTATALSAYDADTNPTPLTIPLFNSISYSGQYTANNAISGQTVNVKVIFEARQSKYVDWVTLGTIYTA